ncbi:MAG: hypothetical protein Q8M26_02210 [Pseudolabrys sp.]|nr:hypothetical protein [Pseudolabrys sp.]
MVTLPFGIGTGAGGDAAKNERDRARDTLRGQLREIERLAIWFFVAVAVVIAFYAFSQTGKGAIFILSVLAALTVTAAAVGGLLGFLFGIPRTLQGNVVVNSPAASTPAGATPAATTTGKGSAQPGRAFAGNSNLEEISDWLTKIIVGVSLVQAGTIYAHVVSLANRFKASVSEAPGADVMFMLVLTAALVGGFLFLYLETRTRVMSLLTDVEAVIGPTPALEEPAIKTALQTPIGGRGTNVTPSSTEDEQLLRVPYGALKTGAELAAWGSAQARAGNFQAANQALRDAIAKEPDKKDYLVRLADVLERQGSTQAAQALIAEAEQKEGDNLALLKRDLVQVLYEPAPESFQKALPIAAKLLARPDGANDPFVRLWTAAAEGQRFAWLAQNNGSEADKQNARARALAEVKKTIELSPDPNSSARVLLRNMLDPSQANSVTEDNDLEVFKNDEEFKTVIHAGHA